MSRAVFFAAVLSLAASANIRAQDDLWFRIESSVRSVACGEAFDVRVIVGAREGLDVEAIDPASLRPLRLRAKADTTEARDGFVVRSLTYEARAVDAGPLVVEAPFARARAADGSSVVAFADDLELDVREVLPEGDDGALELPAGPLPRPFSLRRAAPSLGLGLALVLGASWFVRQRLREAAARRAAFVEPPAAVARRQLEDLRARLGDGDSHRFAADFGTALQTFLARGLDTPQALVSAREEILRLPALAGLPGRERLVRALADLDAAKFAGADLDRARRVDLCAAFEELIAAVEVRST